MDHQPTPPPAPPPCPYASRGGLKLAHAIETLGIDVRGAICADLGCSTGGFTDCLLQHGAARVHAVDTAYGELAWKLRSDDRVTVHERQNALHLTPAELCDIVTIDLSWTRQSKALPAAMNWLAPTGRIITLVKPHYEVPRDTLGPGGVLPEDQAEPVCTRVLDETTAELGLKLLGVTQSPIRGGASSKKRRKGAGNVEFLAVLSRG